MIESDPSDSSDDDYQAIPHMPPRRHDSEASGSSSAPPQPPQTDPAHTSSYGLYSSIAFVVACDRHPVSRSLGATFSELTE